MVEFCRNERPGRMFWESFAGCISARDIDGLLGNYVWFERVIQVVVSPLSDLPELLAIAQRRTVGLEP